MDFFSEIYSAVTCIGTWLAEEGKFLSGVKDQVVSLQDELKCMLCLLEEYESNEKHQIGQANQLQLANYMDKIREITFRAEDEIDTYILKVVSRSEGRRHFSKCFFFLSKSGLIHRTGTRIENIITDAKKAHERLNTYLLPFRGINESIPNRMAITNAIRTYAHIEDENVIGFDGHIKTLVEKLTEENTPWVVGIVGSGGGGKTTLARKVFNHVDITCFKHKVWICISQQWSRRDILYDIIKSTRGLKDDEEKNWNDRELVSNIYNFLKGDRYLIVFDDMWEIKAWDDFKDVIPRNNNGSKVIITTRHKQVPTHAYHNCFLLQTRLLSNEESWVLFSNIAINGRQVSNDYNIKKLEDLGKEMLSKCGGLPLAIVTLAGLLRSKETVEGWELINKACGVNILEHGVKKIIELSYLHLPSYLKPCFLYLGAFPEDSKIKRTLLTQLWMAEGFIREEQRNGNEALEDVAIRYLDELVQRCILQVSRKNYLGIVKEYKLHDLLREFCITKASEKNFLKVFTSMDESTSEPIRRAIFHSKMHLPSQNRNLRSFIWFRNHRERRVLIISNMNPMFLYNLLRVLILMGIESLRKKNLNKIGEMIHLKHLAINNCGDVGRYPKAIGNLRNLLSLDLKDNDGAQGIDFVFFNLTRIRYLNLGGEKLLHRDLGLDNLRDLQTLKGVSTRKWMMEMGGLSNTIKKLGIKAKRITSTKQLEALYRCPSIVVGSIQTLKLRLCNSNRNIKLDLRKLEHCEHMRKLYLKGPIINEDTSLVKSLRFLPNIVYLCLKSCFIQSEEVINNGIGPLSSLKYLCLKYNAYEGTQLLVKSGTFPQLEHLELRCLGNLEEWTIEEGALACLKNLDIQGCMRLKRLPQGLSSISTIQHLSVEYMPEAFCRRLGWEKKVGSTLTIKNKQSKSRTGAKEDAGEGRKIRYGEDVHIIQHVPIITIRCPQYYWK